MNVRPVLRDRACRNQVHQKKPGRERTSLTFRSAGYDPRSLLQGRPHLSGELTSAIASSTCTESSRNESTSAGKISIPYSSERYAAICRWSRPFSRSSMTFFANFFSGQPQSGEFLHLHRRKSLKKLRSCSRMAKSSASKLKRVVMVSSITGEKANSGTR